MATTRWRSTDPYLDVQITQTADLIVATQREMERLRRVLDSTREQIDLSRQIIDEWQRIREQIDSRLPR
jgi:hypothetical protein